MKASTTPPTPAAPAVKPLDIYENTLIVYLKRTNRPTLADVRAIWGWRCEMDPSHIRLGDLAGCLWAIVERLDLMGSSFGCSPGGRGAFGVLCDAAPDRDWVQSLQMDRTELDSPERLYWWRIVSTLCSRLRMSEVCKLPGYNHEATDGPFRYGPNGAVTLAPEDEWDAASCARKLIRDRMIGLDAADDRNAGAITVPRMS